MDKRTECEDRLEQEFCDGESAKICQIRCWCNATFKVLDLEELPLYQEDWLGLASLQNQQKLHKVKSNHENVRILDKFEIWCVLHIFYILNVILHMRICLFFNTLEPLNHSLLS